MWGFMKLLRTGVSRLDYNYPIYKDPKFTIICVSLFLGWLGSGADGWPVAGDVQSRRAPGWPFGGPFGGSLGGSLGGP